MAKGKTARRRLWPMPVEALIDSPDFIAMPAAGAGIVIRLALHFWQTDCRPLPIADHELRNIARAHAPTWRHWKPRALAVLEQIRPSLETYHRQRTAGENVLDFARIRAAAATNSKRKAQALANHSPAQSILPTAPVREPERPPTARQQARDSAPAGAFADRA